jgi:hypothetical protein
MLGSKVRLPTIPSQDLSGVLLAEVDRRRHPGLSHMTTKEHHPNATALEVLRAIAPGGVENPTNVRSSRWTKRAVVSGIATWRTPEDPTNVRRPDQCQIVALDKAGSREDPTNVRSSRWTKRAVVSGIATWRTPGRRQSKMAAADGSWRAER